MRFEKIEGVNDQRGYWTSDLNGHYFFWNEINWIEKKWNEMKWSEMKRDETRRYEIQLKNIVEREH
jgi:hypothetical protein